MALIWKRNGDTYEARGAKGSYVIRQVWWTELINDDGYVTSGRSPTLAAAKAGATKHDTQTKAQAKEPEVSERGLQAKRKGK
jgi:hypothetical protein